jgi:hypothetical protein
LGISDVNRRGFQPASAAFTIMLSMIVDLRWLPKPARVRSWPRLCPDVEVSNTE